MNLFFAVLVVSMTITSIVDYTRMLVVDRKIQWQVAFAMLLGIALALTYKLNLFELIGISSDVPWFSCVITGILMSRGANWLYDFMTQALSYKSEGKAGQ